MSRATQLMLVQAEALEMFKKKNKDYGDAFATYGPVGVLVRLGDKLARLQNITRDGIAIDVEDENIRDTLLDLHNYSSMAIMLLDEDPPRPLRAWRIPAEGSEVVIREVRDGNGKILRECSCSAFIESKFCIHTHHRDLSDNNYEIVRRTAA